MAGRLGQLSLVALATVPWLTGATTQRTARPDAPRGAVDSDRACEPRTPIGILPFVIRRSGSYYLTRSMTGVAGSHGIVIEASDVTLDLNGFTLRGAPGSLSGVWAAPALENLSILHGVVREWGGHGVDLSTAWNVALDGLHASSNAGAGLRAGGRSSASRCTVTDNGAFGNSLALGVASVVTSCLAGDNAGSGIRAESGSVISGCTTHGHLGYDGISAGGDSVVRDCTALGGRISVGAGSSILDCKVSGSSLGGLSAGDRCVVKNSSARNVNSIGIRVGSEGVVEDCVSDASGANGIDAGPRSTVRDCRTSGSFVYGIALREGAIALRCVSSGDGAGIDADRGCSVVDSRVSSSSAIGISVLDECFVSGNVVRTSLDSGIRVRGSGSRVESNQVNGNGYHGIEVVGSGNTLFRNAASGNATSNYAFGAGNAFGAVVNVAGGGSFTADPWSNLEY